MARITISDTLSYVESKYELGPLAAQRVRDLNGGERPVIFVPETEKPTVIALDEIASGKLDVNMLRRELIQSNKKAPIIEELGTLESESAAPELKEFDAELSGHQTLPVDMAMDSAIESEIEESIEPEAIVIEDLPQD